MSATDEVRSLYIDVLRVRGIVPELVAQRLDASVVRPLAGLTNLPTASVDDSKTNLVDPKSESDMLQDLAERATRLYGQTESPEMFEAAAALEDLACRNLESNDAAQVCLNGFKAIIGEVKAKVRLSPNGPLLVQNVTRFVNWLGNPLPNRPLMALCRCGASAMKPYCDGSHARSRFNDAKDPGRLPDHRKAYIGEQVTIPGQQGDMPALGLLH
jgi:CDGSH-type Zn-finger protein